VGVELLGKSENSKEGGAKFGWGGVWYKMKNPPTRLRKQERIFFVAGVMGGGKAGHLKLLTSVN